MPIIQLKLLELLSVEQVNEQSFLHTKLTFEGPTELSWPIDDETAESIKTAINAEDGIKYRLSLSYNWNESKSHYTSFLTRTFRNQSEKVYFTCSLQYVNYINEIKQIQFPHEVEKITSILPIVEPELAIEEVEVDDLEVKEAEEVKVVLEVEVVEETKSQQKPITKKLSKAFITLAAAFVLTIIGFSFSNSPLSKKPAMTDKIIASASSDENTDSKLDEQIGRVRESLNHPRDNLIRRVKK